MSLIHTARSHPFATSIAGASGGFLSWLINRGEEIALLLRLVGGFFGCALAVVSFLFVCPRLIRFLRSWRRAGLAAADRDNHDVSS